MKPLSLKSALITSVSLKRFLLIWFVVGIFLPRAICQPSGLFTRSPSFQSTNHIVSVSLFHWFSSNGGQLSGPWRPLEGRTNWTGLPDFWKTQIKQIMAANIDVLYVHLIPSSEQERINLFQALNELRSEGWNVPKVAPFLDPLITWNGQPLVDVQTTAGKDEFVAQYIRFFNQYFSMNQDAAADDYLARIDNRVVLDTWHVKFNLANLGLLTRTDVESRLQAAFAANHPVFTNGIRMITTALNDPTLSFADEKVPQFEITAYYQPVLWKGLWSAQLKAGYWDQNIRNPGSFLPRDGGIHYSNVWNQAISGRASLHRVYLESWNEYDEGSGMYGANVGPPFINPGSGNTNTDTWSSSEKPYEYVETTARGAALFNDSANIDAKVIWHNIPARMLPGQTQEVTVVVRNEGNASWTAVANYRFGQRDDVDHTIFSADRPHLDDTQDEIPTYGGIFRGRVKVFQLSLRAPLSPGTYITHWSMLQSNVQWFGQALVQTILVDPTPLLRGVPQKLDSTSTFTNIIDDFSEHTYSLQAGPLGSFADCPVTRTFAAPIKSIHVSIVSGTADDIGYVGNIMVTPDSFGTPKCWGVGHVSTAIDVSSQVSVQANSATLLLRAQENCCCTTGWGSETDYLRTNARLHWQVELAPPVPIGPALSNAANGHFYAILSPATWRWSELAAVALGGHLASISSQAEQNYVYNSFSTYNGTNRLLWIGINDAASEGHFVWSSGEPVTFTNWAPGEPNNFNGNEDFTAIYEPGHPQASRWNDFGERITSDNLPINGVVEILPLKAGPPQIDSQPRGVLISEHGTINLFLGVYGSLPLSYQWRKNGVNISGATRSTYLIQNATFTNSGNYSAVITNSLGSVTSAVAVVTVNRRPVAQCAARIVAAGPDCMGHTSVNAGSFDPDSDPITIQETPPGPYPLGVTRVFLIISDSHGLTSSCSQTVTVIDSTPPIINCSGDISKNSDPGQCGAIVSFALPTATDSCSLVTNISCTPASGSFFPVGVTAVQCAATDAAGNIGRCSFNVTIHDTQPPVLTCPSDPILVTNAHNAWTSAVNYAPSVSDNCLGDLLPVCAPPSGSMFNLGTNAVLCSVSDTAANSSECQFNVIVFPGNLPPVPVIAVSPLAIIPANTNLMMVAPDGQSALVTLDGSKSYDLDDTNFNYFWYDGTNLLSTNSITQQRLSVGDHSILLWLDDSFPLGTNSATVLIQVISPARFGNLLLNLIDNSGIAQNRVQPLDSSIQAAIASFQRGSIQAGINQLIAFQNKVGAQIAATDPQLAQDLIHAAQQLIDAETAR